MFYQYQPNSLKHFPGTIHVTSGRIGEQHDWAQFHDPKSLVPALVGEVGELAELFQWLPATDVLSIDLGDAVLSKIAAASDKFPADGFHGKAPEKVQGD